MFNVDITLLQLLLIAFIGWLLVDIVTIFTKNAMTSLQLDYKNTCDSGMIALLLLAILLILILVCTNTQSQINFDLVAPTTVPSSLIPITNKSIINDKIITKEKKAFPSYYLYRQINK